jgi:hypothetical protein
MTLRQKYEDRGRRNHPHGRPEHERKRVDARVCEFLDYAEAQGVRRLSQIEQKHYAAFLHELEMRGVSEWTRYKYQLAIKKLARRHAVGIFVRPALRKETSNRLDRITEVLSACSSLNDEQRAWLTERLNELR